MIDKTEQEIMKKQETDFAFEVVIEDNYKRELIHAA